MPKMVTARDYLLITGIGHTVKFVANKETDVPPEVVEEASAIGAIPVEGEKITRPDTPVVGRLEDMPEEERLKIVYGIFDELMAANDASDFDAKGVPKMTTIKKQSGFKLDLETRIAYWESFLDQRIAESV